MPRNIEDIVVPERKRTIRNIPIPESRKNIGRYAASSAPKETHHTPVTDESFDVPREKNKFMKTSRRGVWVAAGVALLVLIFAILSLFNGATLAYVPKSTNLSFINETFTATKTGDDKLIYSVIKLSGDKGLVATASGEEKVSRKSSGTIIVYNDASVETQNLVENTRFETTDGLVYRIPNAIVIPGKKIVSGVSQPGTVETIIYADVAGEKYNIGLNDFTLPGLKGSARFTTIYARSKTGMSGGFVGMEKVVKSEEKTRVKTELEMALKDELISTAMTQVPEDFILFPSLTSVTFEDLPQTVSSSTSSVTINMRANLLGIMFKKNDLSNYLTVKEITRTADESVDILALDSLNVSFVGTIPTDLLTSEEIKFSVTGEAVAEWRTDEVALKSDLIGKHKRDVPSILNNYPTVVSATATIRPFWKSSFPSDGSQITIKKLPVK